MRIAICDDEIAYLSELERIIRNCSIWNDCEVDKFTFGSNLLAAVTDGVKYDFLFLDIQMPDMDGLALYERIRTKLHAPVIFVSSHTEYSPQVYRLYPAILLDKSKLVQTFDDAVQAVLAQDIDSHMFKYDNNGVPGRINCNLIYYFLVADHFITIFNKGEPIYIQRITLDDIEKQLDGFFRCNRQTLINLKYYRTRSADEVFMYEIIPAKPITLSRRKIKLLDETVLRYKIQKMF